MIAVPILVETKQFSTRFIRSIRKMSDSPFYSFPVQNVAGKPVDFNQFKGKVVLVVNTASKCGFTPQLTGLEALHKKFADKGFSVIGFPCNQFMGQEPNEGDQITEFCQRNYGVTFPVMGKIDVNGSNTHPLYAYLKKQAPGVLGIELIKWNFEKFLVGRDGKVIKRYASTSTPESIDADIAKQLESS